ncbi:hypothetical protein FB384_001141 [Prauserella sediminis]|uniref:Uncharacterized protein n=1 Tax=Prauserella sediminis TaxID=577680 RepID=A0A839XIB2_9PSEU|nr:hypothetical protein [Prauserella sediminis]
MSIFGQVWVFSAIAFVLGAFLAWVFLVRPARKQIRSLEERLVAREADLRRISEPALGAAGTAQTRTEHSDPFSDADEALAGTGGYGGGPDVDVPGEPEPETSWLERDSLGGAYAGGGYAGGGYGDQADDFDLADRPDDLEIPGDSGDRHAHDAGYSDTYRAFAGDDRYDDAGYDDRGGSGEPDGADDVDAALRRVAERDTHDGYGHDGYGYGGYGYDGENRDDEDRDDEGRFGEGYDDRTQYMAVDRGAADDAPVSSVLDPDEMRSVPGDAGADAAESESTGLIGPDDRSGTGEADDARASEANETGPATADDPGTGPTGTSAAADPALHLGAPFRPVTSFDATTELPVGAFQDRELQDSGLQGGGLQSGGVDDTTGAGRQDPGAGDRDRGSDESDSGPATGRSERPGSLFEPTPAGGTGGADAPDAGVSGATAPASGHVDADDTAAAGTVESAAGTAESAAGTAESAAGTVEPAAGVAEPAASTADPVAGAAESVAGAAASNGSAADPEDPPAYAFGGPGAGPDEDPAESTNVLPKRTPRQRPPGGFDAPKPIQPSMRAITRREPDTGAQQSGSLFEPTSPGDSASSEPAAEPATDVASQTGQAPPESQQLTKFVTPSGQVPTGDEAVSGQLTSDEAGAHEAGAGQAGAVQGSVSAEGADTGGADGADAEARPGPFGPGSAMPLPGGGSPSPEFTVKASVTALRYVTDASPQYPRMVAEVWFRSPADAERVGFRPLT